MDDSDSDLSSALSSAPSDVDDPVMEASIEAETKNVKGIGKYFKPTPKSSKSKKEVASPEPPRRAPSPPHEYILADRDAIAFIVMFRSRFSECFAKSLPHYGPQDIEKGIAGEQADEHVEQLLCALLTLCLNRKKPVEKGHYGRALEDAVSEFRPQWPKEWNGTNPVSGSKNFHTMTPDERLVLLRTIILWSLHASEAISSTLKAAYKQTRRDDDRNQPKAVQPWFSDTWRRKYYLIEGQEDTYFRIYRENDGKTAKTNQWFSVAGTIEEAKALAEKFETEMPGNQGRLIAEKVRMAVPRWEAGEEKRKRKDYRAARKAAFSRPEAGFGLYEGRTRGKRLRYTYEEDGDEFEDSEASLRRSGRSTPALDDGKPVVTSSGRQVKSRLGGMYGESLSIDQRREAERERAPSAAQSEDTDDLIVGANGRPVRESVPTKRAAAAARGRYADGLESESETDGDAEPSADEWEGDVDEPDEESEADADGDDDDDLDEDDELMDDGGTQESLVVQLRYRKSPTTNGQYVANGVNGMNGAGPPKASPLAQVENASDAASETKAQTLTLNGHAVQHNDIHKEAVVNQNQNQPEVLAIPVSALTVNGKTGNDPATKDQPVNMLPQPVQPMDTS